MDDRRRQLERQAAQGDEDAEDRLDREHQRAGDISPTRREAYRRFIDLLHRVSDYCPWCAEPLRVSSHPLVGDAILICSSCFRGDLQRHRMVPVAWSVRGLRSMRGIGSTPPAQE